jgi:hypothetical protein
LATNFGLIFSFYFHHGPIMGAGTGTVGILMYRKHGTCMGNSFFVAVLTMQRYLRLTARNDESVNHQTTRREFQNKKRKDGFSEKRAYSTRIGCTPRRSAADSCRIRPFRTETILTLFGNSPIAESACLVVWWSTSQATG